MTRRIAAVCASAVLISATAFAEQTQPRPAGSLNLGVPVQTHDPGCEHQDARARAAGWDLKAGLGVYRECLPHVVAPTQTKAVKPQYTPEAMRAKIQGTVVVAAVINADGSVGDVRVLQSLDTVFGLDDQAVKAVRASTFTPGRMGANAVPVLVVIEQTFTLR